MMEGNRPMTEAQVNQLGLLELAYIGDTVCDLYVRERLLRKGLRVHTMHVHAVRLVNANAQAEALMRLLPLLNEAEDALVRRGKNVKAHHAAPHGTDPRTYSLATAFEALLGSLYLTGQTERLYGLLDKTMEESS